MSKLHRQWARTHNAATHETSRRLADKAQTVMLEDLDIKNMTRSAKNIVEEPGTNVKAKSGLNRVILRMTKALPCSVNKMTGGQAPNYHPQSATQSGPAPLGTDQGRLKPEH